MCSVFLVSVMVVLCAAFDFFLLFLEYVSRYREDLNECGVTVRWD